MGEEGWLLFIDFLKCCFIRCCISQDEKKGKEKEI